MLKGYSYHRDWGLLITGGHRGDRIDHDEIEISDDGESFREMSFRIPGSRQYIAYFSVHAANQSITILILATPRRGHCQIAVDDSTFFLAGGQLNPKNSQVNSGEAEIEKSGIPGKFNAICSLFIPPGARLDTSIQLTAAQELCDLRNGHEQGGKAAHCDGRGTQVQ